MRNLLTAFLVVLLVAACKNSTSPEPGEEEFEPYTIGSFEMTSPTTAEYIGLPDKALAKQSDTTIVTDPVGYGFELWDDTSFYSEPAIAFEFHDKTNFDWTQDDFFWKVWWGDDDVHSEIGITYLTGNGSIIRGFFASPCEQEVHQEIKFEFYDTTDPNVRPPTNVLIVKTDGLEETGKDILGCS